MVNLLVHFPSGESVKYSDIKDNELINNSNCIGYIDERAEVIFSKNVIAGYAVIKVKEK